MPELTNSNDVNVYELLSEDEKQIVTYVISKAFERHYGVESFDYEIKGEIL